MQIVINIPDKAYEMLLSEQKLPRDLDFEYLVMHGTPLPKGHGRLIDADNLTKWLETMASDEWNRQVGASKGLEDVIDIVDDAQAIIEADTEG